MSQDITLMGASYSAVPAVTLPKTGGGTASFTDVTDTTAAASDVASGKYFYTAAGVRTAGTSSGGGSGGPTLLATKALGDISYSSTSASDTNKNIIVYGVFNYDLLLFVASVDDPDSTWNRHIATANLIWLTASTTIGTKNGSSIVSHGWNVKLDQNGTATSRTNSTKYGIFAYSLGFGSGGADSATISIWKRYNATQTGTINGTYTVRVYGIKVYDLIGS